MYGFGTHRGAHRNRAMLLSPPDIEPAALTALIGDPAVYAVYDPTNASTISRPGGGQPTLSTHLVGTLANRKGGGFDLVSPSSSQAPQWQGGALTFDGVDDKLSCTRPGGVGTLDMICIYRGTKTRQVFVYDGTTNLLGAVSQETSPMSGLGNAGGGPVVVNGTSYVSPTRDQLATLTATGVPVVVEHRNLPVGGWPAIAFCGRSGDFAVLGKFLPVALLDSGHANIAAARTLAQQYAQDLIAELWS